MATLSNALTFARAQALTDSNGLTDENGIIFANEALLDFHNTLIEHGIDASQTQESYTSGVANQGTYLYPTDMWFLKAIEVNYTDATPSNYKTAQQVDVSNLANGSFSWLRVNQTPTFPMFDDRGDQFEIFPTPTGAHNLNQMFRIFYYLEPTEYANVSDPIAYPESLDYRILGWRIASSYLKSLSNWDSAAPFDTEYTKKVDSIIKTLGRGTQQPMTATPIQATGWNF
jgi:thioredoxin-related protein